MGAAARARLHMWAERDAPLKVGETMNRTRIRCPLTGVLVGESVHTALMYANHLIETQNEMWLIAIEEARFEYADKLNNALAALYRCRDMLEQAVTA